MKITVLASGSKGNATIIETNQKTILIDAGITLKNAAKRYQKEIAKIDAIIITHSHDDHIKGLRSFLKKYHPKLYSNSPELQEKIDYPTISTRKIEEEDITIELFEVSHDTPCDGLLITENETQFVYITDTGYLKETILEKLKNKDLYLLESNHDIELLRNSNYPFYLQQRILGDKGHLSNKDSASYLKKMIGQNTKQIILAHLSENNNTEELAEQETKEVLKTLPYDIKLTIAKQDIPLEKIEL